MSASPEPLPTDTVFSLRDGAVVLGGRPILRGIDLDVHRGEVLAVLGANGSGKSTLMRALLGLLPLVRGEARAFGVPITELRDRYRIGYVPQRASAASGIPASVREVVASGRLSRRPAWRPAGRADRAAVARALEVVGLADRAGDDVSHLSGGQQQRVMIARALAAEPEVLVLDEPTAGVDIVNQRVLAATLERLVDGGVTVVLVAHELGPLAPLIDRVVVMRDGRVAYDGSPAGLPLDSHGSDHHHHPHEDDVVPTSAPETASPVDRLTEPPEHGEPMS